MSCDISILESVVGCTTFCKNITNDAGFSIENLINISKPINIPKQFCIQGAAKCRKADWEAFCKIQTSYLAKNPSFSLVSVFLCRPLIIRPTFNSLQGQGHCCMTSVTIMSGKRKKWKRPKPCSMFTCNETESVYGNGKSIANFNYSYQSKYVPLGPLVLVFDITTT